MRNASAYPFRKSRWRILESRYNLPTLYHVARTLSCHLCLHCLSLFRARARSRSPARSINQSQLGRAQLRAHFQRRHAIRRSPSLKCTYMRMVDVFVSENETDKTMTRCARFLLLAAMPASASPLAGIIILGRGSVRPFSLQLLPSSKSIRYRLFLRTFAKCLRKP